MLSSSPISKLTLSIILSLGSLGSCLAITPAESDFFEKHIRPIFATRCSECHSHSAGKTKGGLSLDHRAGWQTGGDSGPALIPGELDLSILIKAVRYRDTDLQMPPKAKLADQEIRNLEEWVRMGAPDPREGNFGQPVSPGIDLQEGREFWSFQPISQPTPPQTKDTTWPENEIDQFILANLEAQGLKPAPSTDRLTLLRRTYFNLIGLPPTPNQIAAFLENESPNAFAYLVDTLLESPHFGERWGRHWLDVARFAESSGGGRSLMFKHAWRFRDYVIESFNADKPFDQFIQEQIAGDLIAKLQQADDARHNELVTATGFLALGPTNYELQDKDLLTMEVVDEQVDTMGRAFLGMTLGCARCHDHKFDPIPTEDYYALAGIFTSTKSLTPGNVSGFVSHAYRGTPEAKQWKAHQDKIKAINKRLKSVKDPKAKKALEKHLAALQKQAPAEPLAMGVQDHTADKTKDGHVHLRGAIRSLGKQVPRGFITVAMRPNQSPAAHPKPAESGRQELADWIANSNNPLTARVYVNRVWHHLIGAGLVRTVDNFGKTGEAPSHPELLDYLATNFVANGWSTKKLIRTIISSSVYAMSSSHTNPQALTVDSENRSLWRGHQRRLEAECIRDAMLVASQQLDTKRGGLTIRKFSAYDNGYHFGLIQRRSVYVPVFRNSLLEILETFDFANPNIVQGRRSITTLPTQSLFMLNNPFVMDQAQATAKRLLVAHPSNPKQRIRQAYLAILSREPTAVESHLAYEHLATPEDLDGLTTLVHNLFACLDFRHAN
jgi:hypothetical protein